MGLDRVNIRVYDDSSTEYGIEELNIMFPDAKKIVRRDKNLGCNENTRLMYIDFLTTNDDVLVNMDSDLIVRTDWIDYLLSVFEKTEGIISLYNSILHPVEYTEYIDGYKFNVKNDIGAAGTVFSKNVVHDIISKIPPAIYNDWLWSDMLIQQDIKIYVSPLSYFQHIGLSGTWNTPENVIVDFGVNFFPDNDTCKDILLNYYKDYQLAVYYNCDNIAKQIKNSYSYRLGYFILLPFRTILIYYRKVLSYLISQSFQGNDQQ